jgi:hypothetical protein
LQFFGADGCMKIDVKQEVRMWIGFIGLRMQFYGGIL